MAFKLLPLKGKGTGRGKFFQGAGAQIDQTSTSTAVRAQDARDRMQAQRAQDARDRNVATRIQSARYGMLQGRIASARGRQQAPGINLPQRQPLNDQGFSKGQRGFSTRQQYQPRS